MQERPGAYWPLGPATEGNFEAFSLLMKPAAGVDCKKSALMLQPRHQYALLDSLGFQKAQEYAFKRQQQEPHYIAGIRNTFEREGPRFLGYSEKMASQPLHDLPGKELATMTREWKRKYLESYVYSEPPAFVLNEPLSAHLEQLLAKRMPGKSRADVGKVFALLVATPEKPFATRQEEDFLKIFLDVEGGADASPLLERHAREFGWIPFDYGNELWTADHFRRQLEDMRKTGFEARKRLEAIKEFYAGIGRKQREEEEKRGLSEREMNLFSALRHCSFLIDFKKEIYTKANLAFHALWSEAARRADTGMDAFRFALTWEIAGALESGKAPSRDHLLKRSTHSAYVCAGRDFELMEGGDATVFFDSTGIGRKAESAFSEVKGSCGCAGTAVGRARIILDAKRIADLKAGEVLVTIATTPDFVVGMKKAAAIVTNEGGITCHAAIVSRELGIPCVVGTGNATKAFNDGDLLEVKASHGVVRKIG